jgi:hypothetical protein
MTPNEGKTMRFITDLLLRRTREASDRTATPRARGKSPRARLREDAWSLLA